MTATWFFAPSIKVIRLIRIRCELDHPEALEKHAQIRDTRLIHRCPPTKHRQSTESLASKAMKIAMRIVSMTFPLTNPDGHPMPPQVRIEDPFYHAPVSQPWSYTDLNNQTYAWHNNQLKNHPPAQWMVTNPNTFLSSSSALPMAGLNMATSAYPTVISPLAFVPQNMENLTMNLNTNLNLTRRRNQPTRTTRIPSKTARETAAYKKIEDSPKTPPNNDKFPKVIVYNPPVIV